MVIKEITNRRSVREYKSQAVSDKDILEIIKAGRFAPTARNNQAVEFVVVKEQETKDKIFEIVGQKFVKEAPVLIVPVSNSQESVLPEYDLAVASENMLLQAVSLGLGTVWKNVRQEWRENIKELLKVPKQYIVINIIPVGYPKNKPEPHSDKDFDNKKIHNEQW